MLDERQGQGDGEGDGRRGGPTRAGSAASLLDAAPCRVDRVALAVRDLGALVRFYRDGLGLASISQETDVVRLGAGGRVLLELLRTPRAVPRSPHEPGLFHTAFLLPSRGDLGAWLAHAGARGLRLTGAADHLVSEAVYLDDPEGNGVEIYADRPETAWPRTGDGLVLRNDPLDRAGLARAAAAPWAGMPSGTRVGHVHLQVGDIASAERFYAGLLGFDVMCRYPEATFLGTGGYHHQLAVNTWNSRGASARPAGTTGLARIEMRARAGTLAAAVARCREAGLAHEERGDGIVLHDPWGTRLRLAPFDEGDGRTG